MLQLAKAATEQSTSASGLNDLAVPSRIAVEGDVALERLNAGLYSILVQWSQGKS